ncbi:MAG: prepilin-type N-terminal cleavage/methylation domain-containing protein [Candidatus Binatia bacterium]|jgi:prepilin-type N-terminal cleavage/methylation domain-containing protein
MKTTVNKNRTSVSGRPNRRSGFTLVEVMVASGILGLVVVALFAGITMCFSTVQLSRENVRATQILQDKMESIRLYNWDQINTSGFIPTSFVEPHYPGGSTNSGVFYSGTMAIEPAPITESYSNDLRSVTVAVSWTSDGVPRLRDMQTYVSRYGLQNYIY